MRAEFLKQSKKRYNLRSYPREHAFVDCCQTFATFVIRGSWENDFWTGKRRKELS